MSDETRETTRGARVPGWQMTVAAAVVVAALTAGAGAYVNEARLEVRVDQLERTAASPAEIAKMQAKLDQVAVDLARVSTKIDELAARKPR